MASEGSKSKGPGLFEQLKKEYCVYYNMSNGLVVEDASRFGQIFYGTDDYFEMIDEIYEGDKKEKMIKMFTSDYTKDLAMKIIKKEYDERQ